MRHSGCCGLLCADENQGHGGQHAGRHATRLTAHSATSEYYHEKHVRRSAVREARDGGRTFWVGALTAEKAMVEAIVLSAEIIF